jgi:hypothetical protein
VSETTTSLTPVSLAQVETPRWIALPLLLGLFLVVWACTRAHFMADTSAYAGAILVHSHGQPGDDYHRLTANLFWDFGHLLWRPLGWVTLVITKPLTQTLANSNEVAGVIRCLIGISFLSALACIVFFFLLARRVIGNDWAAVLAAMGFAFFGRISELLA